MATLIDTSSWIEALRRSGISDVRERVRNLLINGEAVWCDMVVLELWNGAHGEYEKKQLSKLEREITCLTTSDDVWRLACKLARECCKQGKSIPVTDLVIASCAFIHNVTLEYCDVHFEAIIAAYKEGIKS